MTDSAYPDLAKVEDWLNAKGYTGEAGSCHAAMDKIRRQENRIADLETALNKYKEDELLLSRDGVHFRKAMDVVKEQFARISELEALVDDCIKIAEEDEGCSISEMECQLCEAGQTIADKIRSARAAYLGTKDG